MRHILKTGNVFCRQVILALVEIGRRTRGDVVEQVKINMGEFLKREKSSSRE